MLYSDRLKQPNKDVLKEWQKEYAENEDLAEGVLIGANLACEWMVENNGGFDNIQTAKFEIVVNYSTGNSFGRSDDMDISLDMTWRNLDVLKENMKRLSEYVKYCKLRDYAKSLYSEDSSLKKVEEYVKDKPYFRGYRDDKKRDILNLTSIVLKADNGNDFRIHACWDGYFESLNHITVRSSVDNNPFFIQG